jgi:hypothetical protein
MIYLAKSRLMLRRLARQAPYGIPSPQPHGLTERQKSSLALEN